jgi:riboflavin kinase
MSTSSMDGAKFLTTALKLRGDVIRGFGRGSKVLGIPTANIDVETCGEDLGDSDTGVYFGWAKINDGPLYKTVMSIGWNPYFKNEKKTIEPWILHDFEEDFYGADLRVLVCGWLRPERDFESLEALIAAIRQDGADAELLLEKPQALELREDSFFADGSKPIPIVASTSGSP